MAKKYYHNISKGLYNETEVVDFIEEYDEGDILLSTEAGNALVTPVTSAELSDLRRIYDEYHR